MSDLKDEFKKQIQAKISAKITVSEWCREFNVAVDTLFAAIKDFVGTSGVKVSGGEVGRMNIYENQISIRTLSIEFEGASFGFQTSVSSGGPEPLNTRFSVQVGGTKMPPPFNEGRLLAFDPDTKTWCLGQSVVARPGGGSKMAGPPVTLEQIQKALLAVFS